MRQKSDDITLVAGTNELNVGMVPIFAPQPFTFSNVSAQKVIMESATAWETMNFFCTITNPNDITVTRLLKVMWRYRTYKTYNGGWSDWHQSLYWSFDLTLEPGQSYSFKWYGNTYGQRDPSAYNGPLIARRTTSCMWLEDEEENKSAEGCVSRN